MKVWVFFLPATRVQGVPIHCAFSMDTSQLGQGPSSAFHIVRTICHRITEDSGLCDVYSGNACSELALASAAHNATNRFY